MPRDIPIIFSAPMVLALLAGRKTMTRRLAWRACPLCGSHGTCKGSRKASPWQRVEPGDRLWVRENLAQRAASFLGVEATNGVREAYYAADGEDVVDEHEFNLCPWWAGKGGLPSIHMPRDVSRLTLTVTEKKVEPLQGISLRDVRAEGCAVPRSWLFGADAAGRQRIGANVFGDLWSRLHGRASWDSNPEVVAVSFKVETRNIDREAA